nr:reverse transcriptase domain-containing protein [Tanacetum cinerariifolium]
MTSSSKLSRDQTSNPTSSTNPTPKGRIRRSSKQKVENSNFEESLPPEIPMADNRTMAQLLQAPIEGYEDAIVILEIAATNFKLKHGLINLVQNKQFFGHDKKDLHAHIRYFNKITSTMRVPNGMSISWIFELHQLDTFYNALNVNDQDSLNSAAGGNFLDKMPADCLKIIESKSKDMVRALLLDKKNQYSAPTPSPTPAPIKAVEPNCVTYGGTHAYQNCLATSGNVYQDNIQEVRDTPCTAPVQPTVIQSESETPVSEPAVTPVSASMPNLKPSIPYHSRRDNERRCDQANKQIKKFYEIFKDMSFEISFTDALMLMPKFASTLKALIENKEKLSKMARYPMNEHYLAVILNKLPKKIGDLGKFLIPSEFPGMDECLALADLGASINLMPLSVWKGLSLPELTPTCMTLELADRTKSKPISIAKDVKVKVGMFHFPADFVVVDFEPDPRVPLILERCFLKTGRALIDVHKGELTLRIGNKAITYNLNQTSRYSANYDQMTANIIDVTDEACEEYSQEVLGFSDVTNHEQSVPSFKNKLKACEAKMIKSSINEPLEVELKDLPPHLEYAFLEGDNKLPVIIAKELGDEEKSALIKVLNSHNRAIA